MADFRKQIEEDIRDYQARFDTIPSIQKDEWAFNYWILDKFFYEEDELIQDRIVDYNDDGIDAFEWYEDTKDLFLIQNKYYDSNSKLKLDYVKNTFLVTPLAILQNGTYTRSQELQTIFNKYKDDPDFVIHLQLYVTNDQTDPKIVEAIQAFNRKNSPKFFAEVYYLSDIESKWYGEPKRVTKTLSVTIETVNKGTILNINNGQYNLANIIDAKYVLTPITCIYRMMNLAKEKGYALFERNIREYLGNKGINKNIYKTLKDPEQRKNFFYYNNGITIICEKIGSQDNNVRKYNEHISVGFKIDNPQIVNGCQTVNSIYTALQEYASDEDVEKQFKDTFVMLKILQIDPKNEVQKKLSKDIVTYNNSQNSIDEKTFVANNELFQRYQNEFEAKGFLLLIKQSDKNTFAEKYKKSSEFSKFKGLSIERRQTFGLDSLKKINEFHIPLEKLEQVVLAFKLGGLAAFTQKKDVLKPDTSTYNAIVEFMRSPSVTTDILLNLYLLYMRAEKEKNALSRTGKYKMATPISFYMIDAFKRYECKDDVTQSVNQLATREKIDKLIKMYTGTCDMYANQFTEQKHVDYIKMIKLDIDYPLLKTCHDTFERFM